MKEQRQNVKKKSRCILVLMLVFSMLTGCGMEQISGEDQTLKTMKIGISVYNQYDTFVSELIGELQNFAKEKEKLERMTITVEILNAGSNQMTQNDQVEYFVENDFDIICVNLVDRTDASTVIETGKNAGIPIIFFNRELVEEDLERWNKLYYVGADAFQSGNIQGDILTKMCETDFEAIDKNGDGVLQYVMLEGEAGHQDSMVRTLYVINRLESKNIQIEKLAAEIANWNRDQAYAKMEQWLGTLDRQIEVCIANNDDMALGAIDALKDAGYTPEDEEWPVILGIDGTVAGCEAVRNKEMAGTVLNDSKGQARGMIELACQVVLGTKMPEDITLIDGKYIRLPYEEIVLETLEQKE